MRALVLHAGPEGGASEAARQARAVAAALAPEHDVAVAHAPPGGRGGRPEIAGRDAVVLVGMESAWALAWGELARRAVWLPVPGSPPEAPAEDLLPGLPARVAALSPAEARMLRDWLGSSPGGPEVELVAPPPAAAPAPAAPGPGVPLLLYVGDVAFETRCDELFAHWAALQDRPRARERALLLVGGRSIALPERPDVHWAPSLAPERLAAALGRASALLVPQPAPGPGLLVGECWARGLPMLVSTAGAVAAAEVRETGAGRAYDSIEEFVTGAVELIDRGDGYRAAAARAHRRALARATVPGLAGLLTGGVAAPAEGDA